MNPIQKGGARCPQRAAKASTERHPLGDKRLHRCAGVVVFVLMARIAAFAAAPFQYQNPVRAGDYPDPSVIRVGADYWATATSSEWAPHFPILHSRDLVNWEIKGYV